MILTPGRFYFWNFRTAHNVRLQMVKRNEHKPQFIECLAEDGRTFTVHQDNLTEEPK